MFIDITYTPVRTVPSVLCIHVYKSDSNMDIEHLGFSIFIIHIEKGDKNLSNFARGPVLVFRLAK